MFSAGQTTIVPTPPPELSMCTSDQATYEIISPKICNSTALSEDQYTDCIDDLWRSYDGNRQRVPTYLQASYDFSALLLTSYVYHACNLRVVEYMFSDLCRSNGWTDTSGAQFLQLMAQCTYQAIHGEKIVAPGMPDDWTPQIRLLDGVTYTFPQLFEKIADDLISGETPSNLFFNYYINSESKGQNL